MDFRPALEVGDVVEVLRSAGPKRVLIDGMGPLPHYRHDFGQLTADSLNQDVTQLDLPDGEMAQYRFSPMALYNVRFNHPGGTEQWRTSTQRFDIPPYLIDQGLPQALAAFYFAASEFWVFKDETPRFDLIQAYSRQVEAYADFWGWRYHYVELERGDEFPVTKVVRANGWPS